MPRKDTVILSELGATRRYESVRVSDLKPYKKNARTHERYQVNEIALSIKKFGFLNPVIIDSKKNIIAGHGRVLGAKKLGMTEVPCIFVDSLTEVQKRAYILADNRLAEKSDWNESLLIEELEALDELDFDLTLIGFDAIPGEEEEDEEKENERIRTDKAYNLDILDDERADGYYQMPVIHNDNHIPKELIGFNYAKTSENKKAGIHFYLDDYQFERIWNNPKKYVELLKEYDCILSPDFSLYSDMPRSMKIWNIFRSRAIGAFMQCEGIKVIPTISWAEPETYQFCFEGIPKGSIVSISTIGTKTDPESLEMWRAGVDAMMQTIEPSAILIYGGKIDHDFGDTEVFYYDNQVTKRIKEATKK